MQSLNPKIDQRPPEQSLARAFAATLVGAGVALVSAPLLPVSPYVSLAVLPLWALAGWRIARRRRALGEDFAQLAERRGFHLDLAGIPRRRGGDGRPLPPTATWHAEWVPFALTKVEERLHSGPATVWRKRLTASPEWLALLDAQRRWLQASAPARWGVVARWWDRWHLKPLLVRRHGTTAVDREHVDAAAQAVEAELRIGVSIAGQPALWTRRLGFGDETAAYAELTRALAALPDAGLAAGEPATPFPRRELPVDGHLFIGRGFLWDAQHTQRLEDLKLRNLSEVTTEPAEQGDPRIYGIGHRQVTDLFLDEPQFNQMAGIFGSTGVGKTRYAEALLVQVIRNGMPLLVIDPKGDQALTNRIVDECRRAGRGHQFRYFCLAAPSDQRTWPYLARYNPCYTYTDPAELAARVASVLPSTKDPFWTNVAKAMVENCLTLCHWANWYLRFVGRGRSAQLPARETTAVPPLLLAMQWARHHPAASPAQAEAAVGRILAAMRDIAWTPGSHDEQDVVDLATTRSLAGAPIYAPIEWIPTVRHVNEYEIDNTVAFLGWMLKIFWFHAYLAGARASAPGFPRAAANAEITAKGGGRDEASMWSAYLASRFHPLELRYEPNATVGPDQRRWVAFYDWFVPHRAEDDYELARLFKAVRSSLETHYSDATRERQKFLEYATTLQSAIKPFLGERARIMCSIDSDIVWANVIRERQVVYCALGSMIDDNGATSCAKMIVQDIAAYFGRRYQYEGGKADPVYIFADEVSSFINDPFIQLLNKCRGVGLRVILAGQTRADLARQLGREGAQQAMGNLNTVIQLRSPLDEDAREFAGRAGDAKVIQENRSVSTSPGIGTAGNVFIRAYQANESRSYQQQTVKRVPPEAVLALPRGQAFVHAKGQVFLLAQGLFDDPTANLLEEIGMHAGVMVDPVRPLPAAPRSAAATPAAARSDAAPAERAERAAPASGAAAATFRPQTDLAAMADQPDAAELAPDPLASRVVPLRDGALDDGGVAG